MILGMGLGLDWVWDGWIGRAGSVQDMVIVVSRSGNI